jgi:hypothetical protein
MLIPLFAAIAPFLVWPIEFFFPYPYVIEELAKAILVLIVIQSTPNGAMKFKLTVLVGVLFAFSETVFYITNLFLVGNLTMFFERLLWTTPLHTITSLIILLPTFINKKLMPVGLILAMIVHYYFNLFVGR